MKQSLFIFLLVFMTCICSCRKHSPALPANSYKVTTDIATNTDRLIKKTYTIETAGLIYVAFEQPGGRNSSSISSDTSKRYPTCFLSKRMKQYKKYPYIIR